MSRSPRPRAQVEADFWAKVDKSGGCWLWTGKTLVRGYGQTWIDNRKVYAHRLAYELAVGPIPPGLVLDHLCHTPACCNPEHLEPVTQSENMRRAFRSGRTYAATVMGTTHCRRGHEYNEQNTLYTYPGEGRVRRRCRVCQRLSVARRKGQAA